jgi:Zn-dependent metalloprotease
VRSEADQPVADAAANQAFDHAGTSWKFFNQVFGRESVDGHGRTLVSSVHYSQNYDNAFWNGNQMVYGDGDGKVFQNFTNSLEVIAHELTHGVTQFSAQLPYQDQQGALNESFSDVFGSLVKQWSLGQSVDEAAAELVVEPNFQIPSTISSITAATLGTRSSIIRGKSCPSPAAIGQPQVTQSEDWYKHHR